MLMKMNMLYIDCTLGRYYNGVGKSCPLMGCRFGPLSRSSKINFGANENLWFFQEVGLILVQIKIKPICFF
jgi:hypothetical protein